MKWIPVKDKKPKSSKEVLVVAPNCSVIGSILIGNYFADDDSWTVNDFNESKLNELVTHWMPLPSMPY